MTITHDNLKYNFPSFGQGLSQNPAPKSGRPRDEWCVVSECLRGECQIKENHNAVVIVHTRTM